MLEANNSPDIVDSSDRGIGKLKDADDVAEFALRQVDEDSIKRMMSQGDAEGIKSTAENLRVKNLEDYERFMSVLKGLEGHDMARNVFEEVSKKDIDIPKEVINKITDALQNPNGNAHMDLINDINKKDPADKARARATLKDMVTNFKGRDQGKLAAFILNKIS